MYIKTTQWFTVFKSGEVFGKIAVFFSEFFLFFETSFCAKISLVSPRGVTSSLSLSHSLTPSTGKECCFSLQLDAPASWLASSRMLSAFCAQKSQDVAKDLAAFGKHL